MPYKDPAKRALFMAEYARTHRDDIAVQKRAYYADNKDEIRKQQRDYRKTHREQRRAHNREYEKAKRAGSLGFRLKANLRSRLNQAVRRGAGSAVRDLGCTIAELRAHLESKFQSGMTWENWGRGPGKWHIDHIRPLASFDLTDRAQFLQACHYTNLQPLWAEENLRKGAGTAA